MVILSEISYINGMLIDGKKIAQEIQEEIKLHLLNSNGRKPCLAVVLVGDHPASKIYIERKTKACGEVGIKSIKNILPSHASQDDLLQLIDTLNSDDTVDGILVQLPLPEQINPKTITEAISPDKDVDGFHPLNVGKMLIGETDGFFPCTPLGISVLLERSNVSLAGINALILGRSNIVGKPMAAILMQNQRNGNATVTVAHSKTRDIDDLCKQADLIITAMGSPLFLKAHMVKEGAIVIDVGINQVIDSTRASGYRIMGDADFENLYSKCSYITPVPGGVGPMTIAMLLSNTLKSYNRREKTNRPPG